MKEDLIKVQYDITKKSKLRIFYDSYKTLIIFLISTLVICSAFYIYYEDSIEKKKIVISENYIKAKINLENGDKKNSVEILKSIISENDKIYSTLSLFLILKESLITDEMELLKLFDHLLQNNKFENEFENLIIFKKALFQSNFASEIELLNTIKPLINSETVWKPHAFLLLGNYFVSKKQYLKAKEFYTKILSLKDLHRELYMQASSLIALIPNE